MKQESQIKGQECYPYQLTNRTIFINIKGKRNHKKQIKIVDHLCNKRIADKKFPVNKTVYQHKHIQ